MSIIQTYKMAWEGEEYNIKFTMGLINAIDEAVNLMSFVQRCNSNDLRITQASKLFHVVLNSEGANLTEREVFDGINGDSIDVSDLIPITIEIVNRCFMKTKKKVTAAKKPRKSTRGKSSTPS